MSDRVDDRVLFVVGRYWDAEVLEAVPIEPIAIINDSTRTANGVAFASFRTKDEGEERCVSSIVWLRDDVCRAHKTIFRYDANSTLPHPHHVVGDVAFVSDLVEPLVFNQAFGAAIHIKFITFRRSIYRFDNRNLTVCQSCQRYYLHHPRTSDGQRPSP